MLAVLSANAQVPSYVPTNGLVGYWPFNGNANDESGNGNNGTVNGATLTIDRYGNLGKAYIFDGVGNYIETLSSGPTGTGISVSYWYRSIQTNENIGVIAFGGNSWSSYFEVTHNHWASGQGPCNGPAITGGGTLFNPGADYNPNNNIWHHVVVVLPSGASSFDQTLFYLDGSLINSSCSYANYGAPSPNIGSANPIKFGRSWQQPQHPDYFQGDLDEVGTWNRALTADEVLALYNGCNLTAQVIAGNITPGAFSNSIYTCNNNAGSTYTWTVNNGVVVSGQGTNSVTILWGAEGVGSVSVLETTADGCVGDEVIYDVNVQCVLSGNAITGPVGPEAFSNSTYTCNSTAGSTYNWTVTNGVIVSGQGTNSVTILWGAEGVGSVTVAETTADGCVGDEVIYDVNVQCVVSGNTITGPVGPEAFSNSTYTCNGAVNSTYNWTVTNGVIASGQGTNTVNILWASTGLGNVSVVETTAEGCVGTTLSQDVVVIPTNVEELSNAMILYPNPATTELNLQITSDLIGTDLFVFDALGKQILKQQILSTNTIINTSSFAAGNYVVKVGGGVKKFELVR